MKQRKKRGPNKNPKTTEQRFLNFVVIMEDGCWHWGGHRNEDQYGRFKYPHPTKPNFIGMAHKFAYEHWIGPIQDKHYILHKCDNPACVNPEHLFTGTQKDNMKDMKNKGRENKARGERQYCAKLTEEAVKEIRETCKLLLWNQ